MVVVAERQKDQPAPPHVVFEALAQPHRQASRPWLILTANEQEPQILEADSPDHVVWSSIWPDQPTARIRFDILPPGPGQGSGSAIRWTLDIETPPDQSTIDGMRYRINQLINANLRYTFGG